jgi:hypothetical protein
LDVDGGSTNSAAAQFVKQAFGVGYDGAIARFVNNSNEGYSSYIFIGSNPGTDWRIGKNISNPTVASPNFEIVDSSNILTFKIAPGGAITLPTLSGTGTRMVVADTNGIISTQAIPTGTVTGSGTINTIAKWTSSSAIGNSLITDNGTTVSIAGSATSNNYIGSTIGSGGIYFSGNTTPDIAYIGYNYTNVNGTETVYQSIRPSWRQHFGNGTTTQWKVAYRAADAAAGAFTDYLTISSVGAASFVSSVTATLFAASESNSASPTQIQINNTSSASTTTKTAQLLFRLADTVGTIKNAAYIRAVPDGVNVLGAGLSFATRNSDADPVERLFIAATGAATFSSSVMASNFYASTGTGFWSDAFDVRRNGFYADGTNLIFRAGTSSEQTRFTISQSTGLATFTNNLTLSASNGTLDVGGEGFIRGNGSAYKTHEFTTGAANVALYQQRNAAGTVINRINADGTSYIQGGALFINATTQFGGGALARLNVKSTGAGNDPAISAVVENAASTVDGVIVAGCLRTATSAYKLITAYSGNGSTDNFSINQFYVAGDGSGYFRNSLGIGRTPLQTLDVRGQAWINRPANKVDNAGCTELPSRVEYNNAFVSGQSGYTVFYYPTASVFRILADYDGNIGGVQPDFQIGVNYLTVKSSGGNIGFVGINTATPTARFEVKAAGDEDMIVGRFSAGSAKLFRAYQSGSDGYLELRTGADSIVTKLSGYTGTPNYTLARFAIGRTTADHALHVDGGATTSFAAKFEKQSSLGDGAVALFANSANSGYSSYIYIGSNPGTDWKIGKNILNPSTATYHFEIVDSSNILRMRINNSTGAVTFSNTVTATAFFESSDSRIKELITDNYRTVGVESIKPKLYKKNGSIELGYFAQDVQEIMGHCVSINNDGFLTLSYREVHTAKIAYLEDSLEEIKAKILYLEKQLK